MALDVAALLGYAAFLTVVFGWRTVEVRRRSGESAWRKPVSVTDAVGEALCGIACVVSLASPVLALTEVTEPARLGAVAPRLAATIAGSAVAIALGLWAQRHLGSDWRAGIEPSARLVTTGPFARVRNPFYLACFIASAGVAVAVPSVVSLAGIVLHVISAEVIVRGVEEPVLAEAHGAAFQRYRRRTGRFLPSRARGAGPRR